MEQVILPQARWSPGSLIFFRFFFVYFVLYIFPFPIDFFPFASVLLQPLAEVSAAVCIASAKTVFQLDITASSNGSGDTSFNYVQVLLLATYSFVAATVWSFVDRKRVNYEKLWYYLIILLRYYVACVLIGYGFIKVFKTQFQFPTLERLSQPYGESSPMGLLWTFMGYSTPYNIFTGLLETIGGLLLLFKRTRLLGALVVTGVMSNIVMLNFSYDVPVKLFSLHLLVMSLMIIAPDVKRLLNFFLFNNLVEPDKIKAVYSNTRSRWIYMIGKGFFITYFLTTTTWYSWEGHQRIAEYQNRAEPEFFRGEFEVESFALNGEVINPGQMDTRRWKKVTLEQKFTIQHMDGTHIAWIFRRSNSFHKFILLSPDLAKTGNFEFRIDGSKLFIEGALNNDVLKIELKKVSDVPYLLVSRGFHWINEVPFNR